MLLTSTLIVFCIELFDLNFVIRTLLLFVLLFLSLRSAYLLIYDHVFKGIHTFFYVSSSYIMIYVINKAHFNLFPELFNPSVIVLLSLTYLLEIVFEKKSRVKIKRRYNELKLQVTQFVGSKRTQKVHMKHCRYATIKDQDIVKFNTLADAQKEGYKACNLCINVQKGKENSLKK